MATPTSVLFSKIKVEPNKMLTTLEKNEFGRLKIRIIEVGRLGVDVEGELSFIGSATPCESVKEALEIAKPWGNFAINFRAAPPKTNIYIYFWMDDESWSMSMELPSPCAIFYSEDYEPGQWLRELILAFVAASCSDVAAFGRRYDDVLFQVLDSTKIIDDLKHGLLFRLGDLSLHAISEDLVSVEDMRDLLALYEKDIGFSYHLTATRYHVFDTVGPV